MARGPDRPARWRIWNSLLARLLAGSALIAACSIAATAWLAAQSTSGQIRQEQGRSLADDTLIYDGLLGYAATHPEWNGVERTVSALARQTGRRIVLTDESWRQIADSARAGRPPLPARPAAVIDPLAVDRSLAPAASGDPIDPRAAGPFQLPPDERSQLDAAAGRVLDCYLSSGATAQLVREPSGRPLVQSPDPLVGGLAARRCQDSALKRPTATEQKALTQLSSLVDTCLSSAALLDGKGVKLELADSGEVTIPDTGGHDQAVSGCLNSARRQQLAPYVSPAALLFIFDPPTTTSFGLSAAGAGQIGLAAAIVLALSVGVSVVLASRLMGPVRALTEAAERMRRGDRSARVDRPAGGELGQLARAFNQMAEQIELTEQQRKTMINDVSHELRTPLAGIRSWLEAAQDGVADVDDWLVSSLLEETLVLQHVVDDLRDLALADAGRLKLHPEPLDAAELLGQVAGAHRARAESAGVALEVMVDGDLGLSADPVRLRQVVGNLVTNALFHTPSGGRIDLHGYTSDSQVVIDVRDSGAGIRSEDLPHVFDRFWRADTSRSRQTGGSGLGLAIVQNLVQAHRGTVAVTSAPGQGATFTVRLPRRRPELTPV